MFLFSSISCFCLRNSSNGSTKIVTSLMMIGDVGLFVVEESTGADSSLERVVDDGDGSSIRRANTVCLWFK